MLTASGMTKVSQIQDELRQIGAQIETAYVTLSSARRAPQELAEQLKRLAGSLADRELEIQAEVATELTEDLAPKLRYSNETARKSEARLRCNRDRAIGQITAQQSILSSQKLDADLVLIQSTDRLKALEYLVGLKVAEATLMASVIAAQTSVSQNSLDRPPREL